MKEAAKSASSPTPFAPRDVPEVASLADLTRFGLGAALDAQKRALEVASRHHALAVRTARELVGVWEGAGEQALADATRLSSAFAERAGELVDRAVRPA